MSTIVELMKDDTFFAIGILLLVIGKVMWTVVIPLALLAALLKYLL